jgi:hypothetical protein
MIVLHGDLNEACLIAGAIFMPSVGRALADDFGNYDSAPVMGAVPIAVWN